MFGLVSAGEWQFGPNVGAEQLARLMEPTHYEEIVEQLNPLLLLHRCRLEARKHPPGYWRVVLEFVGPAQLIELWYSGCGGYRAQYFRGEQVGDAANEFMAERILERFRQQVDAWLTPPRSQFSETLVAASAKVWIKEGSWYRRAKKVDIPAVLWEAVVPSCIDPIRANRLRLKGAATPSDETRMVLKGPWIDAGGVEHPELAKRHRASEIHCLRFT